MMQAAIRNIGLTCAGGIAFIGELSEYLRRNKVCVDLKMDSRGHVILQNPHSFPVEIVDVRPSKRQGFSDLQSIVDKTHSPGHYYANSIPRMLRPHEEIELITHVQHCVTDDLANVIQETELRCVYKGVFGIRRTTDHISFSPPLIRRQDVGLGSKRR